MAGSWRVEVFKNNKPLYACEAPAESLELGRQQKDAGEEGPPAQYVQAGLRRLIVAPWEEQEVSRRHAEIRPVSEGRVKITNVSQVRPIHLSNQRKLDPGASCETAMPVILSLGKVGGTTVRLQEQQVVEEDEPLCSLREAAAPPGAPIHVRPELTTLAGDVPPVQMDNLLRWLRSAMDVLQSAAGAEDFFAKAARAVVEMVGLDSAQVLLIQNGEWKKVASWTAPSAAGAPASEASRHILERVAREKRTFWQRPAGASPSQSLMQVQAVVAAPILNRHGAVLGVLYGDRVWGGATAPLTQLEAVLVELLAGGTAAGLARSEHEQAAASLRVQFEQYFAPDLARQLMGRPDLLTGRIAEVSVLFCDIRNYSGISRRLSPEQNVAWVSDALGAASECVLAEGGVLVDYVGDALMAMWGAPQPQPDHAARAARAALAVLAGIPDLNTRWQQVLGEPMRMSVGVNTGDALVGNTGTRHKFKYGALGHEVNLASRVQGATKYFKTDLLITEATRRGLGAAFATRRLCAVRVVNIGDPVTLYELSAGGPDWAERESQYERALTDFEAGRFREAARALGGLLGAHPQDGPAMLLLSRAAQCLVEEPEPFDPVWRLPGK
jgi:adenylate cyclase